MNHITKSERARRIERAQALLLAAGWSIHDSAAGLIADDLMREFGLANRRTARALEAKAARLLRGEAVSAEIGRPREQPAPLRSGDCAEVITIVGGEAVDAARYTVSAGEDGSMRLSSDESDDLIIRRVTK